MLWSCLGSRFFWRNNSSKSFSFCCFNFFIISCAVKEPNCWTISPMELFSGFRITWRWDGMTTKARCAFLFASNSVNSREPLHNHLQQTSVSIPWWMPWWNINGLSRERMWMSCEYTAAEDGGWSTRIISSFSPSSAKDLQYATVSKYESPPGTAAWANESKVYFPTLLSFVP